MSIAEMPAEPAYWKIFGMDPAAAWVLGPGKCNFFPCGDETAIIPFILSLLDEAAVDAAAALHRETHDGDPDRPGFVVLGGSARLRQKTVCQIPQTAFATRAFFDALAGDDRCEFKAFRDARKRIKLGLPLRASCYNHVEAAQSASQPATAPFPDGSVVVGIIDDGIAFANRRFRKGNGSTRFHALWVQDELNGGAVDPIYGYGRHFDSGSIDALFAAAGAQGGSSEETIYRASGMLDFASPLHKSIAWRVAHGTHVLDLAAGYDPAQAEGDQRPIIAVQLRVASTASQSGADLQPDVNAAIDYIVARAAPLRTMSGHPLPVVINFSYATHDGPHDGTSDVERHIDGAIANAAAEHPPRKVCFVLPAGNTNLARCHAEVSFPAGSGTVCLLMRVQPDDETPSTVQIWLPCDKQAHPPGSSRVTLAVKPPGAAAFSADIPEQVGPPVDLERNGNVYCRVSYSFSPAPTERGLFRIDLQPTARDPSIPLRPGCGLAPSGVWTIRLTNTGLASGDQLEAFIERDDQLYGYPRRGRQAYFDMPNYHRFDTEGRVLGDDPNVAPAPPSLVRRPRMINALGTGAHAIVAGGFERKSRKAADYAAGGPIMLAFSGIPDPGRKPDALVVSDDSHVHAGVLASGTRSGSIVALSGTSMACAQLTRQCADWLARGAAADRDAVKALAKAAELATPGPPLPPLRGGWGRVDLNAPTQGWRKRFVR